MTVCVLMSTYVGYPLIVAGLVRLKKEVSSAVETNPKWLPMTSVIIVVYNEERCIRRRVENVLTQDYPPERLEVIVASDGSTDRTVEIAREYEKDNTLVLNWTEKRGRAAVQDDTVKKAKGEVLIFTDAETVFDKDFIREIVKYFADNQVGCVVGNLIYRTSESSVSQSEARYWKFEKQLRKMESNLGILATATGACMAVRKGLWRMLGPIDDVDFTSPLDVILQGYRVVYAPGVLAYDVPPSTIKGEMKTRIRQTSRNLVGTLKRWGWRGWLKHPLVSWGLLFHKILRWFTPFLMCGAFVSNLLLLEGGLFFEVTFALQVGFYVVAVVGGLGEIVKKNIPIASTLFSFCVANIGMGIGVIKGLLGKAPASYRG